MEKPDPGAYGGDTSSEGYQAEITAYAEQMKVIESAVNLLSPQMAVNTLINGISRSSGATLEDTLGKIWSSIAALTILPCRLLRYRVHEVPADGHPVSTPWRERDRVRSPGTPRFRPGPSPVP